jgi:hypothetical protein
VDASRGSEGEVLYRFVSPARIEQYWKQADVRTDVRAQVEMWVIAKGGGALVQTLTAPPSRGATASPAPPSLPMADLLERSRSRLPPRPYYKGYMVFTGAEGWVWYLSTLSGREKHPAHPRRGRPDVAVHRRLRGDDPDGAACARPRSQGLHPLSTPV